MKTCMKCNKSYDDDVIYCSNCGHRLTEKIEEPVQPSPAPHIVQIEEKPQKIVQTESAYVPHQSGQKWMKKIGRISVLVIYTMIAVFGFPGAFEPSLNVVNGEWITESPNILAILGAVGLYILFWLRIAKWSFDR